MTTKETGVMDLRCYPGHNGIKDLLFRWNYVTRKPIYDFLLEKVAPCSNGGRVLDMGCGNMPYQPLFSEAEKYIGLDVDTAKEYGFEANGIIYYDGYDIPIESETIDVAFSIQVFEHIEDLDHSIDELYRVLKKDGKLFFTVPMVGRIHYMPYDYRRFTNFGIIEMLEKHGFSNISVEAANRIVDTVRYLKIEMTPRPFKPLYTMYQNLTFIYGKGKLYRGMVSIENMIRKILHKQPKPQTDYILPLGYLVSCEK